MRDGWCWPSLSRLARKTGLIVRLSSGRCKSWLIAVCCDGFPGYAITVAGKAISFAVPLSTGREISIGADGGERGRSVATPWHRTTPVALRLGAERLGVVAQSHPLNLQ